MIISVSSITKMYLFTPKNDCECVVKQHLSSLSPSVHKRSFLNKLDSLNSSSPCSTSLLYLFGYRELKSVLEKCNKPLISRTCYIHLTTNLQFSYYNSRAYSTYESGKSVSPHRLKSSSTNEVSFCKILGE